MVDLNSERTSIPDLSKWDVYGEEAVTKISMEIGGKTHEIEVKVASSFPGNLLEVLESLQENNFLALEQLAGQLLTASNHSVSVMMAADQGDANNDNDIQMASRGVGKIARDVLLDGPLKAKRKQAVSNVYQNLIQRLPRSSGLLDKPITVTLVMENDDVKKGRTSEVIRSSYRPAMPKRRPPPVPHRLSIPPPPPPEIRKESLEPIQEENEARSEQEPLLDNILSEMERAVRSQPSDDDSIKQAKRAAASVIKKSKGTPALSMRKSKLQKPLNSEAESLLPRNKKTEKNVEASKVVQARREIYKDLNSF